MPLFYDTRCLNQLALGIPKKIEANPNLIHKNMP